MLAPFKICFSFPWLVCTTRAHNPVHPPQKRAHCLFDLGAFPLINHSCISRYFTIAINRDKDFEIGLETRVLLSASPFFHHVQGTGGSCLVKTDSVSRLEKHPVNRAGIEKSPLIQNFVFILARYQG